MSAGMFSSDDFHTYGAFPVEVTFTGCGGEFCPGPAPQGWADEKWFAGTGFTAQTICASCKRGDLSTVTEYRAQ